MSPVILPMIYSTRQYHTILLQTKEVRLHAIVCCALYHATHRICLRNAALSIYARGIPPESYPQLPKSVGLGQSVTSHFLQIGGALVRPVRDHLRSQGLAKIYVIDITQWK